MSKKNRITSIRFIIQPHCALYDVGAFDLDKQLPYDKTDLNLELSFMNSILLIEVIKPE